MLKGNTFIAGRSTTSSNETFMDGAADKGGAAEAGGATGATGKENNDGAGLGEGLDEDDDEGLDEDDDEGLDDDDDEGLDEETVLPEESFLRAPPFANSCTLLGSMDLGTRLASSL